MKYNYDVTGFTVNWAIFSNRPAVGASVGEIAAELLALRYKKFTVQQDLQY